VASAQSVPEDKRVFFTFSGAVAVPGVTLPAGQCLFRLPTTIASGERHVMQVLSADGRNSYAMFFGISANRTDYPTKPEVRFMETAAGMPPAVKTWSYPGDKAGYEFLFRDPLEREANPRRLRQLAEQSGGEAFELARHRTGTVGAGAHRASHPQHVHARLCVGARKRTRASARAGSSLSARPRLVAVRTRDGYLVENGS
jgi:hypothetical protein